ncbi:MAG: hypothetical protein JXO22_01770 [Phycisphaerae bacterium]|nr:hypothetical protein [Phycisphaerae bacterium]
MSRSSKPRPRWMDLQPRHPESAPRCPRCNYLLHQMVEPRCPECGLDLSSVEDYQRARWLADDNRTNRNAVWAERLAIVLGVLMIVIGAVLAYPRSQSQYVFGVDYRQFKWFITLVAITTGYLVIGSDRRESMHWALLILGGLWLVTGLATAAGII